MNTQIINTIRTDLHNRYGHQVEADIIDRLLDRTYLEHASTATLDEFIPVLVEREVSQVLQDMGVRPRRRVAFVARNNRSKADAAVALANAQTPNIDARTAGAHPESLLDDTLEAALADRHGIVLHKAHSRHTQRTLDIADVAVYLSAEETQDIAAGQQVVWDLPDTISNATQAHEVIDALTRNIENLVDSMKVEQPQKALAL